MAYGDAVLGGVTRIAKTEIGREATTGDLRTPTGTRKLEEILYAGSLGLGDLVQNGKTKEI